MDAAALPRANTNRRKGRPSFPNYLFPQLASAGGIFTSIVSVFRTRPSPPQVRQGVRIFPVPPHRVQGTLNRILPAACCIVPLPLQTGQVCGDPIAPVP